MLFNNIKKAEILEELVYGGLDLRIFSGLPGRLNSNAKLFMEAGRRISDMVEANYFPRTVENPGDKHEEDNDDTGNLCPSRERPTLQHAR